MKFIPELLAADKIAWATDLHLNWGGFPKNHPRSNASQANITRDLVTNGWFCLATGDLGEGSKLSQHVAMLVGAGMHFILGNHDNWGLSFAAAQEIAETGSSYYIHNKVVYLNNCAIVGHNGFFDLRSGIVCPHRFETWDATYILDLKGKSYHQLAYTLPVRAAEETAKLLTILDSVDKARIYLATHVPPFPEACWYQGKKSQDEALPFFCNTTLGDELLEYVHKRRDVQFIVLAGHTHHDYEGQHAPNLWVGVSEKGKNGWYAHNYVIP